MIHHYLHLYAAGAWQRPIDEHLAALGESGLGLELTEVNVGVIGRERQSLDALDYLKTMHRPIRVVAAQREGWENVTLEALRANCAELPDNDVILYTHTKGSHALSGLNDAWRRAMTYWNVTRWRDAIKALQNTDVYGAGWVTDGGTSFFAGNFWWATAAYLRDLPPVETESRYHSEIWIGAGRPEVTDAHPGWPSLEWCEVP